MSGNPPKTPAPRESTVSLTTRRVLRDAVDARRATTVSDLSSIGDALSFLLLERQPKKKTGRRRRCLVCGHMFPPDELHREFDEDGRRIGWVCDGCY